MIVYHHDDLDGITSAAIINYTLRDKNAKYYAVNYGDTWNLDEVKDEVVYVVDFSFPDMQLLNDSCKQLIWIDHHKTAMERQAVAWNNPDIDGERSLDYAGCELTWRYMAPTTLMPKIVQYVGDIDMWEFTLKDTIPIAEAANVELTTYDNPMWLRLFNPNFQGHQIELLKERGKILLQAKELRINKAYKSGVDINFNGLKARIVNSTTDLSEIGQKIYESGYDLAMVWRLIGDKVVVSFRSNRVPVDTIAQQFGGGGHKNAAGATLDMKQLMSIYGMVI